MKVKMMASIDEAEEGQSRADAVMDRLRSEQCLLKGIIGAIVCGLIGGVLAYGMNLIDFRSRTTFATAFIGVLVGFGMRQWGRGIDRRFRWWSFGIALVLIFSSVVLAGCEHRAATSVHTFQVVIQDFLNPSFAWLLVTEAESMDVGSVVLWIIGLAASWFMSGRRLTSDLLDD